jgi:NADH-quinone oxidoreductase subunit D
VEITELTPAIKTLIRRVQRTPLLKTKLTGIGRLTGDDTQSGPLARAGGIPRDARSDDPVYAALGFAVVTTAAGDALARLTQRCGEIAQSLELISRADAIVMPQLQGIGATSGTSQAIVETPRGAAQLSLTLHKGKVTSVDISTPTAAHVALIATVADGREIGDALTAIGSLDISPWEVTT